MFCCMVILLLVLNMGVWKFNIVLKWISHIHYGLFKVKDFFNYFVWDYNIFFNLFSLTLYVASYILLVLEVIDKH